MINSDFFDYEGFENSTIVEELRDALLQVYEQRKGR